MLLKEAHALTHPPTASVRITASPPVENKYFPVPMLLCLVFYAVVVFFTQWLVLAVNTHFQ